MQMDDLDIKELAVVKGNIDESEGSKKKRNPLFYPAILGSIFLIVGFLGMLYGEFGPSLGQLGLLTRGIFNIGLLLLGTSFIIFAIMLIYRDKQNFSPSEEPDRVAIRQSCVDTNSSWRFRFMLGFRMYPGSFRCY